MIPVPKKNYKRKNRKLIYIIPEKQGDRTAISGELSTLSTGLSTEKTVENRVFFCFKRKLSTRCVWNCG